MLWSNPIMSTCAVILPPTMNKKIRFRLYMGCYYFLPSNVQFKVDSLKRYDKKYASPKVLKLSFLFKLSCVEISRISCFLVIRFLNVPLCLPCFVAFIYAVSYIIQLPHCLETRLNVPRTCFAVQKKNIFNRFSRLLHFVTFYNAIIVCFLLA